jgi:L-2,4-diaminobutyrate decarboxylase
LFETDFLCSSSASREAYRDSIAQALESLHTAWPDLPYSGKSPAELTELLGVTPLPNGAASPQDISAWVATVVANSIVPSHPRVMAHLHCPPLIAALAAEVILSGLNQSMDSFDQAPAATLVEQMLTQWLCREAGLPQQAGGVLTAGGSQSNYMALLLARDHCLETKFHWDAKQHGLPADARRLRILCSEAAHFTVEKSAAQLGLGIDAVIRVEVDSQFRMQSSGLKNRLQELREKNLIPMAVVATAGTTDFGSFDPLDEIAELAHAAEAWCHVDAAYGGAALFSKRWRSLVKGIERADSFSVDFHKLFWQPISCAAFALRDAGNFRYMEMHSDYLNPESHEERGIPDLVTRSLLTTRRFDALKIWVSLQTLGREKLAAMIDRTVELAQHAAQAIRESVDLELLHEPQFGCVVFRYRPADPSDDADALNAEIRQILFENGWAVIGHTRVHGRQCLKFTILNPSLSERDVDAVLADVRGAGKAARGQARVKE